MTKKKTFILKNINYVDIISKYSLSDNTQQDDNDDEITMIKDLTLSTSKKVYSFMDESKQTHNCTVTMLTSNKKDICNTTNTKCFWCKNHFSHNPIGCPLRYIPIEVYKKYHSYITNDSYNIIEKTHKSSDLLEDYVIKDNNYYETDGIFCSFNCCHAFILDNKKNHIYKDSLMLLTKIYHDLFKSNFTITPAPHWRNLSDFGGNLSISEFRSSFNKINYIDLNQSIINFPKQYPIGYIYEERIKF